MNPRRILLDFVNHPHEAFRYFQVEHAKLLGQIANAENVEGERLGRQMNEIEDFRVK